MENYKKNWFKFVLGLLSCLLIRLIPVRPPNFEPIIATQMPFSKAYGAFAGFFFAFCGIFLYDFITHTVGMWTFVTSITYGVLGIGASFYFKKFKANTMGYATFAVIGTLFFDAVTGLSIGPLFFHQSFSSAFFGQIPFTAMHLLGNVSFAVILSPANYRFLIENKKFESSAIVSIFNPKTI